MEFVYCFYCNKTINEPSSEISGVISMAVTTCPRCDVCYHYDHNSVFEMSFGDGKYFIIVSFLNSFFQNYYHDNLTVKVYIKHSLNDPFFNFLNTPDITLYNEDAIELIAAPLPHIQKRIYNIIHYS